MQILLISIFFLFWSGCGPGKKKESEVRDYTQYVDPLIGTGGTGHTFPGPVLPFGMVQLSPDTDIGGWERCSGYHDTDSTILGFSLTHLSGTGNGDLGDVMLMPVVGKLYTNRGSSEYPDTTYRSRFSKETEIASPGYYSVVLDDYDVLVELTVSERVGMHRYTFPASDNVYVLMDLTHKVKRDRGERIWSYLQYDDSVSISGYTISHGWARDRRIYWAVEFSKPFELPSSQRIFTGKYLRAIMPYTMEEGEQLVVKAAYSPVSISNARDNLKEIPHWDFDQVRNEAREKWNNELKKIDVVADEETKTLFYTAMYHAMIHPSLFMDRNNQYRGSDNAVHTSEKINQYTIFSLWDTFRALHPLLTIIQPERNREFVYNMLDHYRHSPYNMLPIWSLHGNETWTMIGYHAVTVIAEAYFKGLIDEEDAPQFLKAMVETANHHPYGGIDEYLRYGYVPVSTRTKEPVSMTLEYAFNDWCIAQMAHALGEEEIADVFSQRSLFYKNLFDKETRFMRARDTLGNWATRNPTGIFDPFHSQWRGDYTEGNAWQYTWFVPHDVPSLIELMGGEELFIEKLDSFFIAEQEHGYILRDITGLIGQYAHGNEPSHHVCYLYNYAGKPHKTQEKIDFILRNFYLPERDGIIGNEDAGQMSTWYILSALGFYPVNPVSGVYVIGKPHINEATIPLQNGSVFHIRTENLSPANKYIQRVLFNGEEYKRSWLSHEQLMQGGEIVFFMTHEPSDWGKESVPPSMSEPKQPS